MEQKIKNLNRYVFSNLLVGASHQISAATDKFIVCCNSGDFCDLKFLKISKKIRKFMKILCFTKETLSKSMDFVDLPKISEIFCSKKVARIAQRIHEIGGVQMFKIRKKKSKFFFVTPNCFGRGTWRPPNLPRVLFCHGGDIIQIVKKNPTEKYFSILEKSSLEKKNRLEKNQSFQKNIFF